MKKYLLYTLFGAASLTMASCTEDFNEDVAAPQQWEQEAAITLPDLSVSAASPIDFANVGDSVSIFTFSTPANMPEGTTIENFRVTFTAEGTDKTSATYTTNANGKIAATDLKSVKQKEGKLIVKATEKIKKRNYDELLWDAEECRNKKIKYKIAEDCLKTSHWVQVKPSECIVEGLWDYKDLKEQINGFATVAVEFWVLNGEIVTINLNHLTL